MPQEEGELPPPHYRAVCDYALLGNEVFLASFFFFLSFLPSLLTDPTIKYLFHSAAVIKKQMT